MASPKTIVLAGGGHAHLGVLNAWALAPPPGTARVLVTAARHTAYSGMLPGWMAGLYDETDILIDLEPLAAAAGTRLMLNEVTGLDADAGHLRLACGGSAAFDILSLATGGEVDAAAFAATGPRLLPVRPVPAFMADWQAALATPRAGGELDVAVVGGGAGGFELVCAAHAAMTRRHGNACIALVTPPGSLLAGHAPPVIARARAALAARGIRLVEALAAGHRDGLMLGDGTVLAAGVVIIATGSRAPGWLAGSGLAVTPAGFVMVDGTLASLSHPHILAAGDIIDRQDRPLPRSGVHAVKAGPVLAANIGARITGAALTEYQPPARNLYLMATGDFRAILSWGPLGLGGAGWVGGLLWRLKHGIDSGFMRRNRR